MTQGPEDRQAWSRPGVFPVTDGVHRLPLPLPNDGLRAVNVYAIASEQGLTLIDSGWALAASERALTDGLRELGYGLEDVHRFLITHAHRDHYTQAIVLRERFGTKVALGRGEQPTLDLLAGDAARRGMYNLAELRACGADEIVEAIVESWKADSFDPSQWTYPDSWIEAGEVIGVGNHALEAIPTPGHTSGHVVFRDDAQGILFAGDHVLPHITPSIAVEAVASASPLADYLTSLSLLRQRPDTLLAPAHGPVVASTHARIDELLDHHRIRLDDCLSAVEWGSETAFEVANALRWTRHERKLGDLAAFDQMLAVRETSAHLTVLVSTGRLQVDGAEVRRYAPAP